MRSKVWTTSVLHQDGDDKFYPNNYYKFGKSAELVNATVMDVIHNKFKVKGHHTIYKFIEAEENQLVFEKMY